MKRLYFIRHGLSIDNKNGVYSGRVDTPLTDEGRIQIKQAAQYIVELDISAIVSSPYQRTLESSVIIAEQINYPKNKIYISDLLSERKLGALEGRPYKPSMLTDEIEGIEQTADLLRRAQKALDWIQEIEADNVLIVSHGSLGRAMRAIIKPDEYTYLGSQPLLNGQLTILI